MTERVTSEAVTTYRARIVRTGGGRGVRVPDEVGLSPSDEIVVVIDGADRHARVGRGADGPVLRSAFDTRTELRTVTSDAADEPIAAGDVPDRLGAWLDSLDRDVGASVALDELNAGRRYGLRDPGERVVYDLRETPDDSLQDIAERLGD